MSTLEVIKKNSLLYCPHSGDNYPCMELAAGICNINEKVQASEAPKSGELFNCLFEARLPINFYSSSVRFNRKTQNLPQRIL